MIVNFKLFEDRNTIVNKSFRITQGRIDNLLDYIIAEWRLDRQEDIDYYKILIINMVTNFYHKDEHGIIRGIEKFPKEIELYRIIDEKLENIKQDELGRFWCYDKKWLYNDEFHNSVGFDKNKDWYIVTATFRKTDIDIDGTLEMLIVNTGEREIRIKSDTKPIKYKIEKYDNEI